MAKMTPHRRAVAVTGTYEVRGETKKRYANVGTLFQYEDGGLALKLDSIPVGDGWNGFISFFPIEDKRDSGSRSEPSAEPFSDDVPF